MKAGLTKDDIDVWEINEACDLLTDCLRSPEPHWGDRDSAGFSTAFNLDHTLRYFAERHGYQGWDGAGGQSVAIVRYGCHQPNAVHFSGCGSYQ